ncbi:MAG: hypothetical protein ACOCPN_03315, partial [Desulfonatronovibrionaceae bacterium]
MNYPLRIFGTLREVDPAGPLNLKTEGLHLERSGSVLEIEYEGPYMDVEELLETLACQVQENTYGHVDCIDHLDWMVYRYQLLQRKWQVEHVNPDAVL